MILITGASGKTGRAILGQLNKSSHGESAPHERPVGNASSPVRAIVRRAEQSADMVAMGATEALVGDIRSREDLTRALDGVHVVYHICPNMQPDEVEIGRQLMEVAKAAGVRRIVYHSVLHPQTQDMPHHWNKLLVEEMLLKSGLGFTILQPAAYMQNVLAMWDKIVADGIYGVPYATSTRLGMVDLGDVATVAAKVLLDAGHSESVHNGGIYELATDERFTQDECAALMGKTLAQSIHAEALDREVWRQNAIAAGLSNYAVETLLKMFVYYEAYGFWGNATVLTTLLGRRPTTFAEFLSKHTQKTG